MKSLLLIALIPFALASGRAAESGSTPVNPEARWIQVLQSDQSVAAKDAACVQLRAIGTVRAIPALAALLAHPALSHSARLALEPMPAPAGTRALIAALAMTTGSERLGIVGSLGVRRDPQAIPALAPLLERACAAPPDTPPAEGTALGAAAAAALGEIDGAGALAALEGAWNGPGGIIHDAVTDGILRHANRRLAAGDAREASRLFRLLHQHESDEPRRMVAFQGVIRSAGSDGLRLLVTALAGPEEPAQRAALRLVPDLPLAGAGREFAKLLPALPAPGQVALLNAWMQRPNLPPLETIAPLLESPSTGVRVSAIRALARVGNASVVLPLLELAGKSGPAQSAARLALAEMPARDVTPRLVASLDSADPRVQIEAARALGERGEQIAVNPLLRRARSDSPELRPAALRALIMLINERQVDLLVRLVVEAANDSIRAEAARAVALAYERLSPPQANPAVQPLLRQLARGTPTVRAALLPACRTLALPEIRGALRSALADPDPAIRRAARQVAGQSLDPELLPDLLALAADQDEESRDLGSRGCLRLLSVTGNRIPATLRLEVLRALATSGVAPAQKPTLLAALAGGRTRAELALLEPFLADESVRPAAVDALLKIAPRVGDTVAAIAAVQRVRGVAADPKVHREINAVLKTLEARSEFVTSWQSAAFPRPAGRGGGTLLDVAFDPERKWNDFRHPAARARLAAWEPMIAGTDAKKPMLMRGGGPPVFAATYAYTWVQSSRPQEAQLEVEHDAPMKLWLNGRTAIPAAAREPVAPAETDRANIELNAGWNLLLVKIAQPGKPWSFSVRLRNRDGSPLPEVSADASAEPGGG